MAFITEDAIFLVLGQIALIFTQFDLLIFSLKELEEDEEEEDGREQEWQCESWIEGKWEEYERYQGRSYGLIVNTNKRTSIEYALSHIIH